MRRAVSAVLAALLAAPPVSLNSAPALGTIQGVVTVDGRPVKGVDLALVELRSGTIERVQSKSAGAFATRVAPGDYAVAPESRAGLVVRRAPAYIPVRSGQIASARIDLLALPGPRGRDQETPPAAPLTINHEPVGCLLAGEFPLFEASVVPPENLASARLYFRSAQSSEDFYVEFVPAEGGLVAKLPKPTLAASPVTYHIQANSLDGGQVQSPETLAEVVADPSQCPEGKKMAAIGPPGQVTVFSAATGSAVKPVGFALGGAALTAATIALILAGAAVLGVTAAVTVFNPSPVPPPSPIPTPPVTTPPSPIPPTPSPVPPTLPPATPFR